MPTAGAESLVEALLYVQRWAGETVVIKYGGAAMAQADLADAVVQDLVLLTAVGVRVVLVHGGGPAVTDMGRRLGLEPRFVDGLRVTDDATMAVAQMVHVGAIGRRLVGAIAKRGGRGIGLAGQDAGGWLRAACTRPELGRVGEIVHVDPRLPTSALDAGLIPVVSPVAVDADMEPLNVNADAVATAVACALGAARLIFLTDVAGIRGPDGEVVQSVDARTLEAWIADGGVTGGMIPKARACLDAIAGGVARGVTVADGRVPHAPLLELLTNAGVGTLVRAEGLDAT